MATMPEQSQCEPQKVWLWRKIKLSSTERVSTSFPHEIVEMVSWAVLAMQMIPFLVYCQSFRLYKRADILSGKKESLAVYRVDHTMGLLCVTKDFCLCYLTSFQLCTSLFAVSATFVMYSFPHVEVLSIPCLSWSVLIIFPSIFVGKYSTNK